jgi:RNA polymerase sigma-70 factor (sigma-E family)
MPARRQQDVSAFSDFVAASTGRLFRTAYVLVGDHQLAQDLLQESLIKAYVAWPRLRDESKAEAYTRKIIVTTCISWRRRRSFHERPVAVLPEAPEADQTDRLAAQDDLWAQIHRLPPGQRAAVTLRYFEDLSEAQTAELMGCSVGTVKRQVASGLAKLRGWMGPGVELPVVDGEVVTS